MSNVIDLLRQYNLLSPTDVLLAKKFCETWQVSEFDSLLETHIMVDGALADILAQIFQLERLYKIMDGPGGLLGRKKVTFYDALDLRVLPIDFDEKSKVMSIVVCDPTSLKIFDDLKKKIECELVFSVATCEDILAATYSLYSISDELPL